jgi:hypothetical protein
MRTTRRVKLVAGLLLVVTCALAQRRGPSQTTTAPAKANVYILGKKSSLVAATQALTVQLPAVPTKQVHFKVAYVYCSVDCNITVKVDGAAATATAVTPAKVNTWSPAATALGFTESDVGAGSTVITPGVIVIKGPGREILDLSNSWLFTTADTNLTVAISSITGDVSIDILWEEI